MLLMTSPSPILGTFRSVLSLPRPLLCIALTRFFFFSTFFLAMRVQCLFHTHVYRIHSIIFTSTNRTFSQFLIRHLLVFLDLTFFFPVVCRSFQGIPSTWSSTLGDLGYSEAEIALIQKGRRNDTPDLPSVQDASRSTT